MAIIAKEHREKLDELKEMVSAWMDYFGQNIGRYHSLRSFLFKSNLTESDKQKLNELEKPAIQFNKLEAFVSRLIGEFTQQEPSIIASASPVTNTAPQLLKVLNGYFKQIIDDSKKNGLETEIYKSQMSGGFDVVKVFTDYENHTTFNQKIDIERVFDPTACGFDPMARLPHKADGNYSFERYPKKISELKIMYPDVKWDEMKFSDNQMWSYGDKGDEKVVMLNDLYKKKFEKLKLVYLADKRIMKKEDYKDMLKKWMRIEQPPKVIKERTAKVPYICRYVFIETEVLEYEDTDYAYLPHVFVDGNSALLREESFGTNSTSNTGNMRQFCRPYFYNAIDMQKLTNLSGQTIANKIETLVQSQFMIAQESVPEDLIDGWINPQKQSMLVYNAYDTTGQPIPPPQNVMNVPMPQEVVNSFATADQNIQSILGAYDAALGMQNNNNSGKAIIAGATNSNAAARPYIGNYLVAWGQVATIILDLIPKYMNTPRTIPIINEEGKNEYVYINVDDPNGANFDYDPTNLNVVVKPGVNFEIQKDKDLQMLTQLTQSYPGLAEFMNTEGLPFVFDNLSIRNGDLLKEKAQEFVAMKKQQMAQQQQNAAANNPIMAKMQLTQQELALKDKHKQQQMMIDQEKLKISQYEAVLKFIETHQDNLIRLMQIENEKKKNLVDLAMAKDDQMHKHAKETLETVSSIIGQQQPTQDMQQTGM